LGVGTLRTSEEDDVVAGEGLKADDKDENRRVDEAPKIIIDSTPLPKTPAPAPPVPRRVATPAPVATKQGGLGLVIALYILGAAALGYALYERFG
jgi:hypothetical protein